MIVLARWLLSIDAVLWPFDLLFCIPVASVVTTACKSHESWKYYNRKWTGYYHGNYFLVADWSESQELML